MRFYSEGGMYFWDVDRFHLFTESEKCSLLEGLRYEYNLWNIITPREEGGVADMLNDLIKELEESL